MANKNTRSNTSASTDRVTDEQQSKGTERVDRKGNDRKSNRRSRSGRRSNSDRRGQTPKLNDTLTQFSPETRMVASSNFVFPIDSAAAQNPQFVTCAGQTNFIEEFSSTRVQSGFSGQYQLSVDNVAHRTANVMVLDVVPYFGTSSMTNSWMSPIQLAALNLKQYIDTSFGTVTSYDPQDLALYLAGVSACFPEIAEIRRDLRLAYTVIEKQYPPFLPRGMFAALKIPDANGNYSRGEGIMYTAEHLRSMIDTFNQVLLAFNRLPMPPELGIFGYNDDLFDAIFMDSEDPLTAQLYVFRNSWRWLFDETVSTLGATLVPEYKLTTPKTLRQRIVDLSDQVARLTALRTSSTAMMTNLYNAYGSRDTVNVPLMEYDSMTGLPIVYDPNILSMIENSVPLCIGTTDGVVLTHVQAKAPDNSFGATLVTARLNSTLVFNLPLQFHKDLAAVTAEDIGWALRMHPSFVNAKNLTLYTDSDPDGITSGRLTADGFTGFTLLDQFWTVHIQDSTDAVSIETYPSRRINDYVLAPWKEEALLDFKAAPILVRGAVTSDGQTPPTITGQLASYTAARDCELTMRLADLTQFWQFLTLDLWAGNVNRNVQGTRVK